MSAKDPYSNDDNSIKLFSIRDAIADGMRVPMSIVIAVVGLEARGAIAYAYKMFAWAVVVEFPRSTLTVRPYPYAMLRNLGFDMDTYHWEHEQLSEEAGDVRMVYTVRA